MIQKQFNERLRYITVIIDQWNYESKTKYLNELLDDWRIVVECWVNTTTKFETLSALCNSHPVHSQWFILKKWINFNNEENKNKYGFLIDK